MNGTLRQRTWWWLWRRSRIAYNRNGWPLPVGLLRRICQNGWLPFSLWRAIDPQLRWDEWYVTRAQAQRACRTLMSGCGAYPLFAPGLARRAWDRASWKVKSWWWRRGAE